MPKSRNRKNHNKKVRARKEKMDQEHKNYLKKQKEALMNLIEKERKSGAFDNVPNFPNLTQPDGPSISIDGPTI